MGESVGYNILPGNNQNYPTASPLRVGINAHLLSGKAGYRRAGIHQYVAQVLRHLPADGGLEYVVFTRHEADFLQREGMTAVSTTWPTEKRTARIIWEQTTWPWQARRRDLHLLHSMAFVAPLFSPCPAVITVYDLSFLHFPDRFPASQRWYLTSQTRRSCRRARRVITISESGRQDVHRFFGVPLSRIDVVVPGVDEMYRPYPVEVVNRFRAEKGHGRYLLHVGTLQPRKNIPTLLEAFARLAEPDLSLVLIGGKGWLYDEIFARVQTLELTKRVHFTGYVPDEELPLWYNAAELLVLPSVYEGFGLPALEAMACGTPVVAANSSSLPEAVGNAGLLFAPMDVAELVERLTAVCHDPQLSAKMRALGLAHAAQFSWERAGRETAVVYRAAMAAGAVEEG
ncbi:MAG: glycosyltransferase family 4 protein [Chloroflexi bacterium]|nr:glycosyltransferase family 4 protein [Ardenticatenaceae bacterium]NOG36422.1 glycosyltransferase family 4 protein [Chloroflexota bacterium]GIK57814.1 MAG: glycosyl transferase family 1 [Chloroflexota bacterium]